MNAQAAAWSRLAASNVRSVTALDNTLASREQSIRTINGVVASISACCADTTQQELDELSTLTYDECTQGA